MLHKKVSAETSRNLGAGKEETEGTEAGSQAPDGKSPPRVEPTRQRVNIFIPHSHPPHLPSFIHSTNTYKTPLKCSRYWDGNSKLNRSKTVLMQRMW